MFELSLSPGGVGRVRIEVGEGQWLAPAGLLARVEAGLLELTGASAVGLVLEVVARPGGEDLAELLALPSGEAALARAEETQALARALEGFRGPKVAWVVGPAVGLGTELALSADHLIAADDETTRLGLPGLELGLLPAGGGLHRLIERIGLEPALSKMIPPRTFEARAALELGLVDDVVPTSLGLDVAGRMASDSAQAAQRPRLSRTLGALTSAVSEMTDPKNLREFALAGNPAGRMYVFDQLARAAGPLVAEPPNVFERLKAVAVVGVEKTAAEAARAEAEAFAALLFEDATRRRLELARALAEVTRENQGPVGTARPRPLAKVGLVGAGQLGHAISALTAEHARLPVRFSEQDRRGVSRALLEIDLLLSERAASGQLSPARQAEALRRVSGTHDRSGLGTSSVVIEAVFEDLEAKRRVIAELSAGRGDPILVTTTRSFSVASIASAARRPENVVGIHYLWPARLVEIIRHPGSADEAVATAAALASAQRLAAIVVKDRPGFFAARVLTPFFGEALEALFEGHPIERIDEAALAFGFRRGPFQLLDAIGLDVADGLAEHMAIDGGRRLLVAGVLDQLVRDGRTGRKGAKGFYVYGGRRPVPDDALKSLLKIPAKATTDPADLPGRLSARLVAEAIAALAEGVIDRPRDGDLAATLGLGFPKHRGGPFRFVDGLGPAEFHRQLGALADRFGERFLPPADLVRRAKSGEPFYGAAGGA